MWSRNFLDWISLANDEHRWDFADIILGITLVGALYEEEIGTLDFMSEERSTNQVIV